LDFMKDRTLEHIFKYLEKEDNGREEFFIFLRDNFLLNRKTEKINMRVTPEKKRALLKAIKNWEKDFKENTGQDIKMDLSTFLDFVTTMIIRRWADGRNGNTVL